MEHAEILSKNLMALTLDDDPAKIDVQQATKEQDANTLTG
jgi:hypothetical protein